MVDFSTFRTEKYTKFTNRPSDIAALVELCGEPELSLTTANIPHPYYHKDAMDWVGSHTPDSNIFAIRDPIIVGSISYSPAHQIGYWIGRPFQEQGYATHAVKWLLHQDWCNLHLVWAAIRDENHGSRKVLERNGFVKTDEQIMLEGNLRLNGVWLTKYMLSDSSRQSISYDNIYPEPIGARMELPGGPA